MPGAEAGLLKDLRWAGLQWDEGPEVGGSCGPYRQSERLSLYEEHVQTLLNNRKAYRCFCSTERIDELYRMRNDKGLPLGYDRRCADTPQEEADDKAARGEPHTVRFRAPDEYPKFDDVVYGRTGHGQGRGKQYQFDEPVFDDPILMKSDGFPTYHFANVVDDKLMQITHVIRGTEWMSSTPLHIALYEAFGWSPPTFAHVPLLVDHNKQKLSKRNFDSDISTFRDKMGIFPETLANFAALLGWSHSQKSDVMDLAELEKVFDLKITKGNTIVAFQKLDFLQEQHARRRVRAGGEHFEQMIRDTAVAMLDSFGAAAITNFVGKRQLGDVIAAMLRTESLPYHNPAQFSDSVKLFLSQQAFTSQPPLRDVISNPKLLPHLRTAAATLLLTPPDSWYREIHRANLSNLEISSTATPTKEQTKAAKKDLYAFLRWALLGGLQGPGIPDTMEILGRELSEQRIRRAILAARETENETSRPVFDGSSSTSSSIRESGSGSGCGCGSASKSPKAGESTDHKSTWREHKLAT